MEIVVDTVEQSAKGLGIVIPRVPYIENLDITNLRKTTKL